MKMYPQSNDDELVEEFENEVREVHKNNPKGRVVHGWTSTLSCYRRQEMLLEELEERGLF